MSVLAPKKVGTEPEPSTYDDDYRLYRYGTAKMKLLIGKVYSSKGIEGVERYLAGEKPYLKILRQILNNLMGDIRKETTRGIDVPRLIKNVPYSTEGTPEFIFANEIRDFKLAIDDICFEEFYRNHPAPAPVAPVAPAPVAPVAPGEEFGSYLDVEIPEYIKAKILDILNSPRDSQETGFYTAFSNRLKRIVPLLKEAKIRTSKIEEIYQFIDKHISQNNIKVLEQPFFLRFIGTFFHRPPLDLVKTFINLKAQFN